MRECLQYAFEGMFWREVERWKGGVAGVDFEGFTWVGYGKDEFVGAVSELRRKAQERGGNLVGICKTFAVLFCSDIFTALGMCCG